MRIALSSLADLPSAVRDGRPDAVVSILSPSMRLRVIEGVRHVRLTCHDVEVSRYRSLIGPTALHVERVREVVREGHQRMLLHCAMGLSRSPAFAIVALIEAAASPEAAFHCVRAAVPTASPNRQVLRLARSAFNLSDDLAAEASRTFNYRRTVVGAIGAPIRWVEVETDDPLGPS